MKHKLFFILSSIIALGIMELSAEDIEQTEEMLKTNTQAIVNEQSSSTSVMFTPPTGWRNADATALSEHVNIMVVGQGKHELPPSMTLGTENYQGTLKQYLKRIKEINRSKGYEWKDLGSIRTEAGNASLSQVDTRSQGGDVRMMHVILLRDGVIYILTAAALKEEFPSFYKEIFNSFRSLKFNATNSKTTNYK